MSDHSTVSLHQRWHPTAPTLGPNPHESTNDSGKQDDQHDHNQKDQPAVKPAAPQARHQAHNELDPETWKMYWDIAPESDKQMCKLWNSDLDSLLLFATLFSAVVTAFVIDTYKMLLPDSGDASVAIQRRILLTQLSQEERLEFLDAESSGLNHSSMVAVNTLWFSSLILSLATTFFVIIAKQWVLYLNDDLAFAPKTRGRQHQYRHLSIEEWRLPIILRCLPIFLHIALLLFFAGMVEFTLQLDNTVYTFTLALVLLTSSIYVGAHALSFFFISCPYKTSVTLILLPLLASLLIELANVFFAVWYAFPYMEFAFLQACQMKQTGRRYHIVHLSYILRFRKACSRIAKKALPWFNLTRWEFQMIRHQYTTVDLHALAWITRQSRWTENTRELAWEWCRVPNILDHRSLLVNSGVIPLLAHEFQAAHHERAERLEPEKIDESPSSYNDPYPGHSKDRFMVIIKRCPEILATLVTESAEDDADTAVSFYPNGLPYNRDEDDSVKRSLKSTGVFKTHHFDENEDIVTVANLLRLQTCVSKRGCQNFSQELKDSIQQFLRRIGKDDIPPLNDIELITVVNTILYIGVSWVHISESNPDLELFSSTILMDAVSSDKSKDNEIGENSFIEALEAVMKYKKNMGSSVRRQICYAIWALTDYSNRTRDMNDTLIPIFKKTESIYGPLTRVLTRRMENLPAFRAALNLLHSASASEVDAKEQRERQLFFQAFVDSIRTIVYEFSELEDVSIKHPSFPFIFGLLLQVWYLAFLQYREGTSHSQDNKDLEAAQSHIIGKEGMIAVLEDFSARFTATENSHCKFSPEDKGRLRIATYGAACRLVKLHMIPHPNPLESADTVRIREASPSDDKASENPSGQVNSITTLTSKRAVPTRELSVPRASEIWEDTGSHRHATSTSDDPDDQEANPAHVEDTVVPDPERSPCPHHGADFFDFTQLNHTDIVEEIIEVLQSLVAATGDSVNDKSQCMPSDWLLEGFMKILINAKADADIDARETDVDVRSDAKDEVDKISFSAAFQKRSDDIKALLAQLRSPRVQGSFSAWAAFDSHEEKSGMEWVARTREVISAVVGGLGRSKTQTSMLSA